MTKFYVVIVPDVTYCNCYYSDIDSTFTPDFRKAKKFINKSDADQISNYVNNSIYTNNFVVKARSIEYYIEN